MKKKLPKLLSMALAAAMLITTAAGCSSTATTASSQAALSSAAAGSAPASSSEAVKDSLKGVTLKIGTSGLFGPFSYYDKDGKTLIGYDIDLINALKGYLGFTIADDKIQAMDYSALTTSVAEKKLDMAAAALCVTDTRKKVMDFSQTYQDSGQVVMVNADNDKGITSVKDLAGKKVAVEKGTASHAYAQVNLSGSTVEVHDTITTAYLALEQKKVDAVIQDRPGAAFYIKTTSGTKLKVVGDQFNQGQSPYAIAFTKDFKYLKEFNAALDALKADGTLTKLEDTWCK